MRVIEVRVDVAKGDVEPLMDALAETYYGTPRWFGRYVYEPGIGGHTPEGSRGEVRVTSHHVMPQAAARWFVVRVMRKHKIEGYVTSRRELWVHNDDKDNA